MNDVTLSLCYSCPNVLYAIQQGVFVLFEHIQQRAHKRLYGYFPLSTTSLFKTLIMQLLWLGIYLKKHMLEIYYCKNHSLKGQVFVKCKSNGRLSTIETSNIPGHSQWYFFSRPQHIVFEGVLVKKNYVITCDKHLHISTLPM